MTPEKKLSSFINESKKLIESDFEKKTRIAVIGSFTLNGLAETLQVKSAELNIFSHIYSGPYNQYNEEILNPKSNLYSFNPEICFLILDAQTILENLFYFPYDITETERKEFVDKKFKEISALMHTTLSLFSFHSHVPYSIEK